MTSAHPDFEALSAHIDGEAPEWVDHVAACAECRATAAQLRALANAVAAPVAPPIAVERERALAAALGAAEERSAAVAQGDELAARRRRRQPWALPAVAAVIIAVLGFSGLVLSSYRSPQDETTTLAGPGLQSDKADTRAPGAAESGVGAAAPSLPVGDLGDVRDAATLRARAPLGGSFAGAVGSSSSSANSGPTPAAPGPATAPSSATNTGNTPPAAATATPAQTPTTTLNQRAAAPNVVGTRPCEEQARTRDATLGPVTYFATARQGQVQAFVLGFSPAPGRAGPSLTLLMLTQDGCAELLRTTVP